MKMISECPTCGKEHIMTQYEIEELIKGGKVVIDDDCKCGEMYIVMEADGCYFEHKTK